LRQSIVERQHGHTVGDRGEIAFERSADALSRRICRAQGRIERLQLLQLAEQLVELRIADLGGVLDVVEIAVVLELCAQRGRTLPGGGRGGGARQAVAPLRRTAALPADCRREYRRRPWLRRCCAADCGSVPGRVW